MLRDSKQRLPDHYQATISCRGTSGYEQFKQGKGEFVPVEMTKYEDGALHVLWFCTWTLDERK
jgi:hypothetical protein